MIGVYAYKAGATAAQVAADLAAMIGGAAVAGLSAICDKNLSSAAGAASGWAVLDAAYGVVKGADLSGADKFVRVMASGSDVAIGPCEGWNAATHAAQNAVTVQRAVTVAASGGVVYVLANAEAVTLWAADGTSWACVVEICRDSPMLPAGYPVSGLMYSGAVGYLYCPRFKNPTVAGDTVNAWMVLRMAMGVNIQPRAPGEVLYWQLMPMCAAGPSGTVFFGYLRGCYEGPAGATGARLVDAAGVEYVQLMCDSGQTFVLERR